MAKDKERKTARILYVEQGKTAKEIAGLLNVAEKTISAWVNKYAWKAAQTAKITNRENRISNIRKIIDGFAQDRLDFSRQIAEMSKEKNNYSTSEKRKKEINSQITELRQELARIDSGVANWNKTLENIDKTSRISLSIYLYVMKKTFSSLQKFNPKLFMKTLDFQEQHINDISTELG